MTGISVIIPTLNRKEYIKDTLSCLLNQAFEFPYEIIIVDQSDRPDDVIAEFTAPYAFVKYLHVTHFRGLPQARNFGWQKAVFDYVLFLDDDILCDNNLLQQHYNYISLPDTGVVAGGITEKFKKNSDGKTGYFDFLTASPQRGFHKDQVAEVDHAAGCNFSTKRKVLAEVNGIDENLSVGASLYEETDFCLRVKAKGYKVIFNYNAHITHLVADTGGCRVADINKYVYSLARNRTIIINRHLNWFQRKTANIYLLKLALAYTKAYKKGDLLSSYYQGVKNGNSFINSPVKNTQL